MSLDQISAGHRQGRPPREVVWLPARETDSDLVIQRRLFYTIKLESSPHGPSADAEGGREAGTSTSGREEGGVLGAE